MSELTEEQLRHMQWMDNPPKFYCKSFTNAETPMSYCDHQCFECMAVVGETRIKNNKTMATVKREGNIVYIQVEDRMRKVGEIMEGVMAGGGDTAQMTDASILLIERNREKHMMMVWQAYGFSKEVMDHKDWFGLVQLDETDHGKKVTYLIPREDLILHGRLHQSENFERQYFVPVEKLQKYKV